MQISTVSALYDLMAYLAQDDNAILNDNLRFFSKVISSN